MNRVNNTCVHAMFPVQKGRGDPALQVPSAPELRNRTRIAMPPKPNSTFSPVRQQPIDDDADTFEHISLPVARVMYRLAEAIREAAK